MALLREEFALIRPPLIKRQLEYFKLAQRPGESFTSFMHRLEEAGANAEIENMTTERLKVVVAMAGTRDKELLDRFLELDDPTCEDLYNTACKYEAWQRCFPKRKSRSRRGNTNNRR